jgi:hypothetical protein
MAVKNVLRKISGFYKDRLNIKSAMFRAVVSLLFIPLELVIFVLSFGFDHYVFPLFEKFYNIPMEHNYNVVKMGSFSALFVSSVGIFLIHIVIYMIFKLIPKIKINLELLTINFVIVICFFYEITEHGGGFPVLQDMGFTTEVNYIFTLIYLIIFSVLIHLLDLKYEKKQIRKILLCFVCSIILGFAASGLLWPVLYNVYEPAWNYNSGVAFSL